MRNERVHVDPVIDYLAAQDIESIVIDHGSDDGTREKLERRVGNGVREIVDLRFDGVFSLGEQLRRKADLAADLPHEWIIHHDADEHLEGALPGQGLRDAIDDAHRGGYDAINFEEFVFVPAVGESHRALDHRHTMLRYYYFAPSSLRLVRAVRRRLVPNLVRNFGHRLDTVDVTLYPRTQVLRHYFALSHEHLVAKYSDRRFDPTEMRRGAHTNHARLALPTVRLPLPHRLHWLEHSSSSDYVRTDPRRTHFWEWDAAPTIGPLATDRLPAGIELGVLVERAREADSRGDRLRARNLWAEVLQMDDAHMWAHLRSALLLGELGEPMECDRRLLAARERWPEEAAPRICLAHHATRVGDTARAESHWAEVLDIDPVDLWAMLGLAVAASHRGDRMVADSFIADAMRHHADRPEPWVTEARISLDDKDWERAEAACLSIVGRHGRDPTALDGLARAANGAGRTFDALAWYRRLSEAVGLNPHQTVTLARLHASSGDYDRVARLLTDLVETDTFGDASNPHDLLRWQAVWGLVAAGRHDLVNEHLVGRPMCAIDHDCSGRATILDSGLAILGGHQFNLTRYWRDWLCNLGLGPVEILANRRFDDPTLRDELGAVPYFAMTPSVPSEWLSTRAALRQVNEAYRRELSARPSLAGRSLLIDHSCRLSTIGGFVDWLCATDSPRPRRALAGIIETDFLDSDHPHHRLGRQLWAGIADRVTRLDGTRLLVTAETSNAVEFLRDQLSPSTQVMLASYLAAPEGQMTNRRDRTTTTVGYLGATRPERGIDVVGPLIGALLDGRHPEVRVLLQVDIGLVRKLCGRRIGATLAAICEHPLVEVVPTGVSESEYHRFFESVDVLLLPYQSRYEHSGSGIFVEGLAAGKVQVLPASSSMAATAQHYGAEAVSFDRPSLESILRAAHTAITEFDQRRPGAMAAARRWRDDQAAVRSALATALIDLP